MTQTVQFHIHRLYDQIFYQDRIDLNTQILRSERLSLLIHKLRHTRRIFLSNLKPDQQQIYSNLWQYWDMEENLSTFEKDLDRCRLSLEQKMDILQSHADSRQNNLLFVIAIVQLLALLGVANDYFDLNDRIGDISTIALLSLSFITLVILIVGYLDRIKGKFSKEKSLNDINNVCKTIPGWSFFFVENHIIRSLGIAKKDHFRYFVIDIYISILKGA